MPICHLANARPAASRPFRELPVLKIVGFCLLALMLISFAMAGTPARERAAATERTASQTRYGLASYYGKGLQGKQTAEGATFDKNQISAAHPTYPMGTRLKVTNLKNGRTVNVRVNDRGPIKKHRAQGVIIDLSEQAARELGFKRQGKTRVKTEVLEWGEPARDQTADAGPPK
ncbi:MAG: septal ring lytic transglycosylase RlpA family protein [Betaproteobacteria bacterium]